MKLLEFLRLTAEPFLPPLLRGMRLRLLREIRERDGYPSVLDIGGRKSPYTIGVPADETIMDLPRESELQNQLNLGINDQIVSSVLKGRSNVNDFIYGDMTKSDLQSESFDIAMSVEVLEHVEEDETFVKEVSRVLRSNGVFLMSTPNGDFVKNRNPDHKRHYKKDELAILLEKYFSEVEIEYAIRGGYYRKLGLKSWSVRRPLQTGLSAYGNILNSIQSRNVSSQSSGTHHLIVVARKK